MLRRARYPAPAAKGGRNSMTLAARMALTLLALAGPEERRTLR
jgi:hypothetical protein